MWWVRPSHPLIGLPRSPTATLAEPMDLADSLRSLAGSLGRRVAGSLASWRARLGTEPAEGPSARCGSVRRGARPVGQ